MKITVIGVVPPCPRCAHIYDLAVEAANELGIEVEMSKIAYDSEEAQGYGKVGTAHHIAEWANMEIDWSKIREIISEGWSKELDDFLEFFAIEPVTIDENLARSFVWYRGDSSPQQRIRFALLHYLVWEQDRLGWGAFKQEHRF